MYLYSSPSTADCQQITNFKDYAYGQLQLSDNSFFMLGSDLSSPYPLHLYKFSFGKTSTDWALKMAWPSSACTVSNSESLLLLSSSIYSFFIYGQIQYLYFAVISSTDGSVTLRYKSSDKYDNIYGSWTNGNYIFVAARYFIDSLLIFNIEYNTFSLKLFVGFLNGMWVEDFSGR